MTWAKVDDHANEHRKQLAAGAEACWLWTCGLMYANRQAARDGFIPDGMLGMLYPFKAPVKIALRLVEVGLWNRVPGGYLIHEFTFWNQTKEQRESELASGRERAAKSYSLRPKNRKSSPEEQPQTPGEENTVLQDSSGSTPTPTPLPKGEEIPLPPATERRSGDGARCLDALTSGPPARRPEVQQLFAAWKRTFGMPDNLALRESWDGDACRLASAVDQHGLSSCLMVLKYARDDDKVSGRTDELGEKHESIGYIFENENTFARILRLAHKREAETTDELPSERIERLKKRTAGAA